MPLILLAAAVMSLQPGLHSAPSPTERFMTADYRLVHRVQDLPAPLQQGLSIGKASEGMADPGEDFNAGCIVDQRPGRRLTLAGNSGEEWFVFYDQGGRALHARLELWRVKDGAATRLRVSELLRPGCSDLACLRAAIKAADSGP